MDSVGSQLEAILQEFLIEMGSVIDMDARLKWLWPALNVPVARLFVAQNGDSIKVGCKREKSSGNEHNAFIEDRARMPCGVQV